MWLSLWLSFYISSSFVSLALVAVIIRWIMHMWLSIYNQFISFSFVMLALVVDIIKWMMHMALPQVKLIFLLLIIPVMLRVATVALSITWVRNMIS